MKFKILSDSTCDLPREILEKYNVTLIPLTVVKAGRDYKDGLDMTPGEIFAHVDAGGELCSTSAVSVGEYEEFFEKYAAEYDGVLLINLGSGFSSCHQNARVAAEEFANVRCIDSRLLASGQGLLVIRAAQLAEAAESIDALAQAVESLIPQVEGSFVLDQLKYMAKGGRCSSATALGANLLNLKPCIELKDGKLGVTKKYRGSYVKSLTAYIKDRLADRADLDTSVLSLIYTVDLDEDTLSAVRSAISECAKFDTVIESFAGCTISCHCGPGTLGLMYFRK